MKIKTTVEFSGVPKGTTGEAIWDKTSWKIVWDLKYDGLGIPRLKPLTDWFSKEEFEKFLVVVEQ